MERRKKVDSYMHSFTGSVSILCWSCLKPCLEGLSDSRGERPDNAGRLHHALSMTEPVNPKER